MIRVAMLTSAMLLCGAASAQELAGAPPATETGKKPLLLRMKGGEVVLMKGVRLQGDELCGQVYRSDAAPGAGCVAKRDVAGARFGDARSVGVEGARGALCVVLAQVCFGRVTQAAEGGVRAAVAPKS